jgi:three-Cys-motif partner protein
MAFGALFPRAPRRTRALVQRTDTPFAAIHAELLHLCSPSVWGHNVSANENFFRERRAQAVFKHGILSRYPTVFASKTGWQGRRVMFVDGYAGRGEYEDETPGSPALLLGTAATLQSFRDVSGIYVEQDPADFANLEQVVARAGQPNHEALRGDVRDHLPSILDRARNAALFVFLDPFGTALERDKLVGPLLGRDRRHGPTEVLLHFSISTLARMGGILRSRAREGVPLSPKDQKTVTHGDLFLGGDWWHHHFEPVRDDNDEERASVAALRVAQDYQAAITHDTGYMAASMPIRPAPGQLPKYVLVLFTRNIDGLWHFADAAGCAGREWYGAWQTKTMTKEFNKIRARNPDGMGLFDVDAVLPDIAPFDKDAYEKEHRDEWTVTIAENITRLLASGPFQLPRKIVDVYGTVLGTASEKHVRAAVKSLHRQGIVTNTGVGRYFFREPITPTS